MISVFVSYTKEYDSVAEITVSRLCQYCERHGYDLTVHRGGFGARDRLFCFQKSEMAAHLLAGCDYLFIVDVDMLITNCEIKLEPFVDDQHHLFACEDVNGLNAGAYIVRNCAEGKAMLQFVVAYARTADEGQGDQDGLAAWIRWNEEGYKCVPHPAFNSYMYAEYGLQKSHEEGQWQPGDFILHLPGLKNERRCEIFQVL